jgi:hypothetical protein
MWGKNCGAQHRSGELIDPAKPRDLLPAGQGQLFDGIHLSNIMGLLGTIVGNDGFSSGRRRRLFQPAKPTLKSARAGQVAELGVQLSQANENIRCSPAGMFFVQKDRLLDGGRRRFHTRGSVGGLKSCLAVLLKNSNEMTHGTRGNAELKRDRRRRRFPFPHGERKFSLHKEYGTSHGTIPKMTQGKNDTTGKSMPSP